MNVNIFCSKHVKINVFDNILWLMAMINIKQHNNIYDWHLLLNDMMIIIVVIIQNVMCVMLDMNIEYHQVLTEQQ